MAEKAGLLWPRLPRNLGRGQACQALPGRIFLVSVAKNPESLTWPGFARLAEFLTGLLMQGEKDYKWYRPLQFSNAQVTQQSQPHIHTVSTMLIL